MEKEFIKEERLIEKTEDEKNRELLRSIILTKEDLEQSHKNFELAEKDLIDYYVYKIKANQAKLDYLIKLAKSKGLVMDILTKNKLNSKREVS